MNYLSLIIMVNAISFSLLFIFTYSNTPFATRRPERCCLGWRFSSYYHVHFSRYFYYNWYVRCWWSQQSNWYIQEWWTNWCRLVSIVWTFLNFYFDHVNNFQIFQFRFQSICKEFSSYDVAFFIFYNSDKYCHKSRNCAALHVTSFIQQSKDVSNIQNKNCLIYTHRMLSLHDMPFILIKTLRKEKCAGVDC